MRAASAPPCLIKPLILVRFSSSSSSRTVSLNPSTKLQLQGFHLSRIRPHTISAMAGANANVIELSPEHVAGKWYSVPELRLRDHRFTVPLDYSLDRSTSPKISVFAREVVAGKMFSNLSSLIIVRCSLLLI